MKKINMAMALSVFLFTITSCQLKRTDYIYGISLKVDQEIDQEFTKGYFLLDDKSNVISSGLMEKNPKYENEYNILLSKWSDEEVREFIVICNDEENILKVFPINSSKSISITRAMLE